MATRTASCNCGQLSLTYEGPDPETDPYLPLSSATSARGGRAVRLCVQAQDFQSK